MNTDRILALADLIESLPHTSTGAKDGFCMSSYTHNCNTPSCIAGWAAFEAKGGIITLDIHYDAKAYLGLDGD